MLWRGIAKSAVKKLKKRDLAHLEGKTRTRSFAAKAGIKKYTPKLRLNISLPRKVSLSIEKKVLKSVIKPIIMKQKLTLSIKRDDGTFANIAIEPNIESEGGSQHNGIYHLYWIKLEYDYIGDIVFHEEEAENYIYTGVELSDDELVEVAQYISDKE